jgi:hypothetical protein
MSSSKNTGIWRKNMTAQVGAGIEPRIGDYQATKRIAAMSPRSLARMGGVFELLEGTIFTFGQVVVLGRLVVSGDAAATAHNILANETLYRLGFAATVIGVMCHIVWVFLFYDLFKPVNRNISLLAVFVMLVGCAIQAIASLLYYAPLLILGGSSSLGAFTAEQSQALALTFLKLNGEAFNLYLIFFGLWCILIGYLIFRSTFLPRILGMLLAIDGVGWVLFLSPPLAITLFPFIAAASGLAELPLMLWLLVKGVNPQRWKEQASAAREAVPERAAV